MLFDIVFISYQEPNADTNWEKLIERFPYAKRLHGVKGIHQAHRQAARMVLTKKFWVVDADSIVSDEFNFEPPHIEFEDYCDDGVYVYRSKNPVNGLEYGNGGIKLLPKKETMEVDVTTADMTTSISKNFIPMNIVASVTNFNCDEFNAWKSAFRECVKLSSRVIDGQVDHETEERLSTWCTIGEDKEFGEWCIRGANDGVEYGTNNKDNKEALKLINDFNWLNNKFNEIQQKP